MFANCCRRRPAAWQTSTVVCVTVLSMVEDDRCPETRKASELNLDFAFTGGKTPVRGIQEPALRIETDINSKLVKFIDPTPDGDTIEASFVRKTGTGDRIITTVPTYFAAFARADKRVNLNGDDGSGGILSGAFFKNIHSKRLRFIVDGSGSMSACVMWGEGYSNYRTYYDPDWKTDILVDQESEKS